MKPNWRATYVAGLHWISLDFYLKPREGQEGKKNESLKAFDFADSIVVRHMFDLQGAVNAKLEEVTYLGD